MIVWTQIFGLTTLLAVREPLSFALLLEETFCELQPLIKLRKPTVGSGQFVEPGFSLSQPLLGIFEPPIDVPGRSGSVPHTLSRCIHESRYGPTSRETAN